MYLDTDIHIKEFQFKIVLPSQSRNDNILAFGELWMINEIGDTVFKQKGFTVKERVFYGSGPVNTVDFPAFRAGRGFVKSFIAEAPFYEIIQKGFMDKFLEKTDGSTKETNKNKNEDEINIDDIPF